MRNAAFLRAEGWAGGSEEEPGAEGAEGPALPGAGDGHFQATRIQFLNGRAGAGWGPAAAGCQLLGPSEIDSEESPAAASEQGRGSGKAEAGPHREPEGWWGAEPRPPLPVVRPGGPSQPPAWARPLSSPEAGPDPTLELLLGAPSPSSHSLQPAARAPEQRVAAATACSPRPGHRPEGGSSHTGQPALQEEGKGRGRSHRAPERGAQPSGWTIQAEALQGRGDWGVSVYVRTWGMCAFVCAHGVCWAGGTFQAVHAECPSVG